MTQEKEAFEAWVLKDLLDAPVHTSATDKQWRAWQARASLAQPASVPALDKQAAFEAWLENYPIQIVGDDYELCSDAFDAGVLAASPQAPQPAQPDQSPAEGGALAKALERMDRARAILTDGNPRPVCNWGMLDTTDLRATSDVRPKGADLNLNDPSVQKRLAAQWGYVQAPAPGDALLPMIERLEDAASAALTQAHNSGKVVHKAGVYMPAIETGAELARAIIALRDFASKGAEPHVWLYDFIDGETTVRNWSTTNKAEAFAPGNFNQRGYVPAEN